MLSNLMNALTEHLKVDGAVDRPEFDIDQPAWPEEVDPNDRLSLERYVFKKTPSRHTFRTADGEKGIVYFDARGRATTTVVSEMGGDDLLALAKRQGRRMKGNAPWKPSRDTHHAMPELAEDEDDPDPDDRLDEADWKAYARNYSIPEKERREREAARLKRGKTAELKKKGDDPQGALQDMIRQAGGRFWNHRSWWFVPTVAQKNGGAKGLQLSDSDRKKPKQTSIHKSDIPGGRQGTWKAKDPPAEIKARFGSLKEEVDLAEASSPLHGRILDMLEKGMSGGKIRKALTGEMGAMELADAISAAIKDHAQRRSVLKSHRGWHVVQRNRKNKIVASSRPMADKPSRSVALMAQERELAIRDLPTLKQWFASV